MVSAAILRACTALILSLVATILAIAGMAQSVFYSCSGLGQRAEVGLLRSSLEGQSISNCKLNEADQTICTSTLVMLAFGIVGIVLAAVAMGCDVALLTCRRRQLTDSSAATVWSGACVSSGAAGVFLSVGGIAFIIAMGNSILINAATLNGATCQAGTGPILCIVGQGATVHIAKCH